VVLPDLRRNRCPTTLGNPRPGLPTGRPTSSRLSQGGPDVAHNLQTAPQPLATWERNTGNIRGATRERENASRTRRKAAGVFYPGRFVFGIGRGPCRLGFAARAPCMAGPRLTEDGPRKLPGATRCAGVPLSTAPCRRRSALIALALRRDSRSTTSSSGPPVAGHLVQLVGPFPDGVVRIRRLHIPAGDGLHEARVPRP